jgi:hypothetical protein
VEGIARGVKRGVKVAEDKDYRDRWNEKKDSRKVGDGRVFRNIGKIVSGFLPVILIIILFNSCRSEGENVSTQATKIATTYAIGQKVAFSGLDYTVTSVEPLQNNDGSFIRVNFKAKNTGRESVNVSNGMIILIDHKNRQYESEIVGSSFPGSMNPGIEKSGHALYEVPAEDLEFRIGVRKDMFDFGGADYKFIKVNK